MNEEMHAVCMHFFSSVSGMPLIGGESPQGAQLIKPIAISVPGY